MMVNRWLCGRMMNTDTKAETPREGRRHGWFPCPDDGSHRQTCQSVIGVMERRKSEKEFGFECGTPSDVRAAIESIEDEAHRTLKSHDEVRINVTLVGQEEINFMPGFSQSQVEELCKDDHKVQE